MHASHKKTSHNQDWVADLHHACLLHDLFCQQNVVSWFGTKNVSFVSCFLNRAVGKQVWCKPPQLFDPTDVRLVRTPMFRFPDDAFSCNQITPFSAGRTISQGRQVGHNLVTTGRNKLERSNAHKRHASCVSENRREHFQNLPKIVEPSTPHGNNN